MGWYAVEDAGAYTFVVQDARPLRGQMAGFCASQNAAPPAVKAVAPTHHHGTKKANLKRR